jgi:hypothetical protein
VLAQFWWQRVHVVLILLSFGRLHVVVTTASGNKRVGVRGNHSHRVAVGRCTITGGTLGLLLQRTNGRSRGLIRRLDKRGHQGWW